MLVNLFQSAIVYDSLAGMMTELGGVTAVYQNHFAENLLNFPQDTALARQWQARTEQTIELLHKFQTLVA